MVPPEEVRELAHTSPHIFFRKQPGDSMRFNAITFHDLQVLKENYHIMAFLHAQFPKNTA